MATGVNASDHRTIQSYIDALVAPARALRKDRFFTYITSIAEENAFFEQGMSAGFGIRLVFDQTAGTVSLSDVIEGSPASEEGLERGHRILAIGTTSGNLRAVSEMLASGGVGEVVRALGPSTIGSTRFFEINTPSGRRTLPLSMDMFVLDPISDRYGVRIIVSGGRSYGYLNLRTFIDTAGPQLRTAFAEFREQGITNLIIDFRYNGGGLVSIAQLMGDLLGRNRRASEVFVETNFRPEKFINDEIDFFESQPESIAPTRIAFIATDGTASASEIVINGMHPYLRGNMALVGGNTFGKPVGQIGLDLAACDDRLRVVAFSDSNADGEGEFYDGLASQVTTSCVANDDLNFPLGDVREDSVRTAIAFLSGRGCSPSITATSVVKTASLGTSGAIAGNSAAVVEPRLIMPDNPSPAQREVPGLF